MRIELRRRPLTGQDPWGLRGVESSAEIGCFLLFNPPFGLILRLIGEVVKGQFSIRCGWSSLTYSTAAPSHGERLFDCYDSKENCLIFVYTIEVAIMQTTKVGIREFRENLANYLESKTPVAITRHGSTIGIYVPTKPKPSQADLEALRVAGERVQELIAAAGTTEDEIVASFKKARRARKG
jgi:hypothetical protein